MKERHLVIANITLATILLTSLFLIGSTSSVGTYDPWADINDDGYVNAKDAIRLGVAFDSSGTPLTKAAILYDSGWINITDKCGQYFNVTHNLNSTDIIVDIQGKATTDGGTHQRNLGGTGYMAGWNKPFGGAAFEIGICGVQTSDGGYAVAGHTTSFGAGSVDFWLIKTDSFGNMQWNKTYGGTGAEFIYSMTLTNDGGYAIVGYTDSFGAGNDDGWLVKTDSFGNMQWNKTYGGTGFDYINDVIQTNEGGYAIVGETNSAPLPGWLIKTDANGNILWNKTYDGCLYSIVQTSDGGYAVAGYTAGLPDCWMIKTDSSGNHQWNKTYGGANDDRAMSAVQTGDGGYAIAGYTNSLGAGEYDFWLIKTGTDGNMQWNRTYGGVASDSASCVIQTNDGGFALVGYTDSFGTEMRDLWLIKTDADGNMQWNRTYGGKGAFPFAMYPSIEQTSDMGYIIAGDTNTMGAGFHDVWLIKTDPNGNLFSWAYGVVWTDSTADTITLYRGITDADWNYVRVRVWKIKETP